MLLPWRDVEFEGITFNTSLTQREADELQRLTVRQYVLEVGSAYGYSSRVMSSTASHVFAVDPHAGELPGSLKKMRDNLSGVDNVTIMVGYSDSVLPALLEVGARFGLVFIDGCHLHPQVDRDLGWARSLGDVVAVHDYHEDTCPDVAEAVDEIYGTPRNLIDTLAVF